MGLPPPVPEERAVKRSTEHILTTHTGSLPRPPELTAALRRRDLGEANGDGLDAQVRDAVADVVRLQAEFPDFMQRVMGDIDFAMPVCAGPVAYRDLDAVRADIANLKAAVDGADVEDAFMSAASPGVIAFFLPNRHYASHEEYVAALADAMKQEYDAIHEAGIVLQLDCPDLAMTAHMQGEEREEFLRRARVNVEAI